MCEFISFSFVAVIFPVSRKIPATNGCKNESGFSGEKNRENATNGRRQGAKKRKETMEEMDGRVLAAEFFVFTGKKVGFLEKGATSIGLSS